MNLNSKTPQFTLAQIWSLIANLNQNAHLLKIPLASRKHLSLKRIDISHYSPSTYIFLIPCEAIQHTFIRYVLQRTTPHRLSRSSKNCFKIYLHGALFSNFLYMKQMVFSKTYEYTYTKHDADTDARFSAVKDDSTIL